MTEVSGGSASAERNNERGTRGWVDRSTGEVHGAGAGAGGGNAGEDHDDDPASGAGAGPRTVDDAGEKPRHPLPESPEARHNEIPETDEREKGRGEDGDELIQPNKMAVDPDGVPYVYGDLGR